LLSAPLVDTDVPSHAVCRLWAVRWVAGLLPARLMGVSARPGLPGHGQPRDLAQRNEAIIRLGTLPNTVQGSQLHIMHTHRHLGKCHGPNKWPQRCGLAISPPNSYVGARIQYTDFLDNYSHR